MTKTRKLHPAWVVFIGACIMSVCGYGLAAGTSGVYYPVVTAGLGISYAQYNGAAMSTTLAMMVTMPFIGTLLEKVSVKLVAAVTAALLAASFFVQAVANGLPMVYLGKILNGIGGSTMMGMLGNVLMSSWFKARLGTVLGVMTAAGGLGAAVLNPAISWVVSTYGWRTAMHLTGFIILLVMVPVSLFMFSMPSATRRPYGEQATRTGAETGMADASTQADGVPAKQARRMPAFYLIAASYALLACVSVIQHQTNAQATSLGYSLVQAGWVASAAMLGTGASRLLMGILLDVIRPSIAISLFTALSVVGLLGLALAPNLGLLVASGLLVGCTSAVLSVGGPYILQAVFGTRDYAKLVSTMGVISSLAPTIVMIPMGMVYDQTGSYSLYIYLCVILAVVGAVTLLAAWARRGRTAAEDASLPQPIPAAGEAEATL